MKLNTFLRKASISLNITNILVGLVIGIAHVYLPLAGPFGLVLGILTAVSCSVSIGISYYFTYKTTDRDQSTKQKQAKDTEPKQKRRRFWLNIAFLGLAVPMILLNAVAGFFGMYTGIALLAAGFAMPFTAPIMAAAIIFATIFTAGTLINAWLQTDFIWQSLNRPQTNEPTIQTIGTQTEAMGLTSVRPTASITPKPNAIQTITTTVNQTSDFIQPRAQKQAIHQSTSTESTATLFQPRSRATSAPARITSIPTPTRTTLVNDI
ncbi:MAG: hypothetical protein A3F43_04840 [Gammaproteobacteria bacterium RIFCSPHIGHO2_12_FULL_42_10]|nr:MAG: hypothetical protein A3F43_04840 [Gammaproteobacteria bacterium RIFCSPHIGHO2_12_FULL_42_10]